jgi:hypothetical protein
MRMLFAIAPESEHRASFDTPSKFATTRKPLASSRELVMDVMQGFVETIQLSPGRRISTLTIGRTGWTGLTAPCSRHRAPG